MLGAGGVVGVVHLVVPPQGVAMATASGGRGGVGVGHGTGHAVRPLQGLGPAPARVGSAPWGPVRLGRDVARFGTVGVGVVIRGGRAGEGGGSPWRRV